MATGGRGAGAVTGRSTGAGSGACTTGGGAEVAGAGTGDAARNGDVATLVIEVVGLVAGTGRTIGDAAGAVTTCRAATGDAGGWAGLTAGVWTAASGGLSRGWVNGAGVGGT